MLNISIIFNIIVLLKDKCIFKYHKRLYSTMEAISMPNILIFFITVLIKVMYVLQI